MNLNFYLKTNEFFFVIKNVIVFSMAKSTFSKKTLWKFMGSAGILVATGYIDPGNFSTNLAASSFKYSLLFVILFSNIMAVIFQSLCIKLGVVTKLDLAENCKKHFHPFFSILLYLMCECAIIATDLAEVIGSAIALNLLFDIPILYGVLITGFDTLFILLFFNGKHLKYFERGILLLVLTTGICFSVLVFKTTNTSDWKDVFLGFIPNDTIIKDSDALYISMGIVGATLMFHNLFLHSNLVKYRSSRIGNLGDIVDFDVEKPLKTNNVNRSIPLIIKYYNIDSFVSLSFALFINASILISAASANIETNDITDAFHLFNQILGKSVGILFAIALLFSAQSSTITGTLTGQIIMTGFLGNHIKIKPYIRRLITRMCAIVPALIVILTNRNISDLLLLSQVILSLQLPFALWPLVYFTSNKKIMTIKCVVDNKVEIRDEINTETGDEINTEMPLNVYNEKEEMIDFSNGIVKKIIVICASLLLSFLNMYLLFTVVFKV